MKSMKKLSTLALLGLILQSNIDAINQIIPIVQKNLIPTKITISLSGINLPVYAGYNAYPAPQNPTLDCTDLLIPVSARGTTIDFSQSTEPVAQYNGIVSDIRYTVNSDGSISISPADRSNPPFSTDTTQNVRWLISQSQKNEFYWLDELTKMGKNSDPNFALPQDFIDLVQGLRAKWIAWMQNPLKANQSQKSAKKAGKGKWKASCKHDNFCKSGNCKNGFCTKP